MTLRMLPLTAAAVLLLAACGGGSKSSAGSELPQGSDAVELNPADFTTDIDNPYWPMSPGSRWVYRETDGQGDVRRVEVTVTSRTKTIDGIEARVVHDLVTTPTARRSRSPTIGTPRTRTATSGTWARTRRSTRTARSSRRKAPGSTESTELRRELVPAEPKQGLTYREEYYAGHAEDGAEVLGVNGKAEVPAGRFSDALMTRNFTSIEPT